MSAYGSNNTLSTAEQNPLSTGDDISEMIAWSIVGPWWYDNDVSYTSTSVGDMPADHACQELASDTEIENENVTVLAKLALLRDLGVLSESQYSACTNDVSVPVGSGAFSPGFHVYDEDTYMGDFIDDVDAGIQSHYASYFTFYMNAAGTSSFDGKNYPTDLSMQIEIGNYTEDTDQVSWPRGVYSISPLTQSEFFWIQEDNAYGSWYAISGEIFVHSATNDQIFGTANVDVVWEKYTPEVYDWDINFFLQN